MLNQNHTIESQNQAEIAKSSPPPPPSSPLPPSLTPSPSHEFSFTISLHHHNCSPTPSPLDLAPADEIFFHGHLLPLDKLQTFRNGEPNPNHHNSSNIKSNPKPSFSSLVHLTKWLKSSDVEDTRRKNKKKKKSFGFSCCWKKEKEDRHHCSLSVTANDSREGSSRWRWIGEISPPVTIWTSPTSVGAGTSSEESTMAELQNAVQAAIAHCKKSIAVKEEKLN
ncbi:BRI1 kinase inhibitor 1-like [Phalaenopsis equestris]|uniref:BRI1 kinase inhibitor 1-like n=1 Tax=Phalaenopsis equestris TaxID=78828 RepID=UPI0009E54DF9|nr:BRI1 kinase inhibitor 1-like [Phalaenopsis equestris]